MDFEKLSIDGPLVLKPNILGDERGFFFESWNQNCLNDLLLSFGQLPKQFVQDNHSRSLKGVLRGMHYQISPHPQAKLVRCVVGEIYDVVIDLRRNSSTRGQSIGVHLSSENFQQLWVPVGFAHGFLTLSDYAEVLYKTTDFWSPECERSIRWNDPELAINWCAFGVDPQLSNKDSIAPFLSELSDEDLFA